MAQTIHLQAREGRSFEAVLELPESPNGRGLVVLPEVYNVNAWVRGVARRYAGRGYTVLVPDLFWRQQPGCHYEYDQPDAARAQGAAVDIDAVVSDVGVLAASLRDRLGAGAGIGVVGYCLGGLLAVLAGARERVDAVVSYYGVRLEEHLDELAGTPTPTLLFFGETDPWVPAEVVAQVQARIHGRPQLTSRVFTGAGHGFDRDGQPSYRQHAAEPALRDSLALFDAHLGLPPVR